MASAVEVWLCRIGAIVRFVKVAGMVEGDVWKGVVMQ